MKRLFLAAALIGCLGLDATLAQGVRIHRSCYRHMCTTTILPADAQGLGKTIDVPADADDVGREQRTAKWLEFCKPDIVVDSLGVSRYVYAHRGCDTGRAE